MIVSDITVSLNQLLDYQVQVIILLNSYTQFRKIWRIKNYFRFHSITPVHFSQQLVTTTFWTNLVFGSFLCMSNFHAEVF